MDQAWMSAAVVLAAMIGCTAPMGIVPSGNGGSGAGNGTTGTHTGTTTIPGDSGLPCEVATVLWAHCTPCHASPPASGTPMPLLGYADLTAQKNGVSYAQLSVDRMSSTSAPMPPGG